MSDGRTRRFVAFGLFLAALLTSASPRTASASLARSPVGPPLTVQQLLQLPGAYLIDVNFSSVTSAVAEWSNCALTNQSPNCRWAYTATDDRWRTSRALPFLDKPGPEGGNDRWVLSLAHGAVLSTHNFVDDHVVELDGRVYPVTVSHKALRAVAGRTVVGDLPDFTTVPETDYFTLYDPRTRSLHPVAAGGAVLNAMTTSSTPGTLYAQRERSRGLCLISTSTDGGGTWVDHGTIACRGAYKTNENSVVLGLGDRLVTLSPADPFGRVRYTRGHFWVSASHHSAGRSQCTRRPGQSRPSSDLAASVTVSWLSATADMETRSAGARSAQPAARSAKSDTTAFPESAFKRTWRGTSGGIPPHTDSSPTPI